jgi:hypothetical protein
LYALIGSKALFNHEWAWMPFTPGLAIATALVLDWCLTKAEEVRVARSAKCSLAALLVLFAVWTGYSTLAALHPTNGRQPFTPMELGEAIQAAAPNRGDVALLVGGEEAEAQLWFYGDRALRTGISSVQDFERRIHDDTVDLVYNFEEQPWDARATGLVFPKAREHDRAVLHAYLKARYPLTTLSAGLDEKFEVFDVRVQKAIAARGTQ